MVSRDQTISSAIYLFSNTKEADQNIFIELFNSSPSIIHKYF